ncbi:glycosyltransferase family 88 protein [Legionella cincinnatiensis]|uniref:Glucosyltransferase Lgt1 n=1 Tax=Legionella cincinnatiensis TaxID=28085 RepID=A0A378IJJ1_9GAMM|nr:glycosyltransferase family 88 protein [Legionella cincinnatiensis]KTC78605.1 putative glucosyltransferase Lgt1 [Legionella cincinnatiensis]STX35193.1 putative glucosyltransferase Lgt1 [Legionella cincinnatiensis]
MYQYNPRLHVKIWLSNDPNVFMNLENQIRLLEMREKNPHDTVHLVYDSTLLTRSSVQALYEFSKENNITLIDAYVIEEKLEFESEKKLYGFYKEEISNLNSGGNLGVASDILRWLSPIFKLGTYTDFDVPIDTTNIPSNIPIESPLLLNIGSLKIGKKEFILANNDFVAIIDDVAAKKEIERVQSGLLATLAQYDTDFIEKTEKELITDSFINRYIVKLMKNRSESLYIAKSKELISPDTPNSSLKIRAYIHEMMMNKVDFLNFKKISPTETSQDIINRLRKELQSQLNLIKYLFFSKEYSLIKYTLEANDEKFLSYLMKKEHDLYLKSIVICTTGPIQIANSLFNDYVVNIDKFRKEIQPLSFNYYGLQNAFRSQNSIPLHENVLGMLKFLGVEDGELNDSSWLNTGKELQASRIKQLAMRQQELALSLPLSFSTIKNHLEAHIINSSRVINKINQEKMKTLRLILNCFQENEFDILQFKKVLLSIEHQSKDIYTYKLIEDLKKLTHEAVIFSLAKEKKIEISQTF